MKLYMMSAAPLAMILAVILALPGASVPRAMIVVDEATVRTEEAPPHGAIGMSTAYRISDAVPARTLEFRKRVLHPGAAIGAHAIAHDEVYYVLAGEGIVTSGAEARALRAGMAAYLYDGATVGIRQTGTAPLALIIAYPVPTTRQPAA